MSVGDFVLRRGDGVYAYQLVVAVDDAAMRISHVVRADDLLASTPRQILLMRLLGVRAAERIPSYAHVPMVVSADGDRLAKRVGSTTIRSLRDRGLTANDIVGALAHGLGLVTGDRAPDVRARSRRRPPTAESRWHANRVALAARVDAERRLEDLGTQARAPMVSAAAK